MNEVILLTGGNLGDRMQFLQNAKKAIEDKVGSVIQSSPIIKSKAWGFDSIDYFLNQVLIVKTSLNAIEVLDNIQEIERKLGRIRKSEQWVSRLIDIDILFYNNEILISERLTIPHKHIQNRRFTLFGLNFIAPKYIHPQLNKTIHQLLMNCTDNLKVEVYHV